ncbi:uncharacterized protein H6S33_006551 [Morchella sextelata]|uniref:uncharacterized protein n=1 Tax=Morchella sextelata TaxID=1174677 RepID=UPI001D056F72|nr:uncharacterized protein H6S33_006551 [Morchella sextelata]KAH0604883.1 hypothetical protein H6S33_006551 [Morchella sextelata]
MPSPPPEMVNILSHLRFGELDEDLTGLNNSNVLTTQAAELLSAESTTHAERLFLTLLLGMVNQNAILQRQIEGLKDDFEEAMTKHSNLTTTITNRLERIEGRLVTPPAATPPPQRIPPNTKTPTPPPNPIYRQPRRTFNSGKLPQSEDVTRHRPPPRLRKTLQPSQHPNAASLPPGHLPPPLTRPSK